MAQSASAFGSDWYWSAAAGANFVQPMTLNSASYPFNNFPRTLNFGTGLAATASLGHHFGTYFRAEGELSFRTNSLNGVTVQGEGSQPFNSGSVSAFGVMANGWFDIPLGGMVTPYLGGGIGTAMVNLKAVTISAAPCVGCDPINVDSSQWAFAYQLGAGVAVDLGGGTKMTFDYRYFATNSFTVPLNAGGAMGTTSYTAQSALVGLRFPISGMGN